MHGKEHHKQLRKRVKELEGKKDRGVRDTANLAQLRVRQTVGDFAEENPKTTIGLSALAGAGIGMSKGPEFVEATKNNAGHVKDIVKSLTSHVRK